MPKSPAETLQRILMVPPKHFTVEYAINPWMGGVVDKDLATKQWNNLKNIVTSLNVEVLELEQLKELPDQVFVCNSGVVCGNNVYVSKFRYKERVGEQPEYLKWFRNNGYKVFGDDYSETFEGGGDAVFSDEHTLWAGYGERSTEAAYDKVKQIGDFEIIKVHLVNPKFYHLDTCFAAIDATTALYYPDAFTKETQAEILKRLPNSIAVTKEEADAFVCNAIAIRKTVISPIGLSKKTKETLFARGFQVADVDMSEFIKSGGGCQCLIMRL
ncbi:unnamed protein product [Auanema sp. JU1783]|nr:unnamed protein product [Auanema sp. JU1783]